MGSHLWPSIAECSCDVGLDAHGRCRLAFGLSPERTVSRRHDQHLAAH